MVRFARGGAVLSSANFAHMERPGEIRLMVRGIPRGVSITEVADLFARFGADAERIALPRDRRTRRRKGYAYVIVPSKAQADAAIAALHGLPLGESKPLEIELAVERPPKPARRGGGGFNRR